MQRGFVPEIDPVSLQHAIGGGSYARGVEYLRQQRVAGMWWDQSRLALEGRVRGRDGDFYTTIAYFSPGGAAALEFEHGECSCPMVLDCKHVVALTLAGAASGNRAGGAAGAGGLGGPQAKRAVRPPEPPQAPAWEQSLRSLLPQAPATARVGQLTGPSVAIELSLTHPAATSSARGSETRLSARLVQPGKNGGWIAGNLSWGRLDLLSYYGDHRADHVRLLGELYAIHRSNINSFYLYGSERSIDLTGFESRQLWPLLDEAASIGLPVIYARKLGPVPGYDYAEFCLEVSGGADAGSLVITPAMRMEEARGDETLLCFIGTDGHGLVYTDGVDPDRFRLARLARPVPAALQRMMLAGQQLEIPAQARSRFADEYYLQLRQAATLVCTDDSFTPPEISGPVLVLSVRYGDGHQTEVGWHWAYEIGENRLTIRPDSAADSGAAYRDHDGEQALLAELDAALGQFGLRPSVPQVRLGGFDTVRLTTELLPLLASHPQVELEITGEPVDYREVGDSLVIGVSVDQVAAENDWFDLGITISVEGRQIPFIDVFLALSRGETYLLLPDGAYFSLEKPQLQQLARLIEEARALQDSPSDPLKISRYQAALWEELADLGVVSHQAQAWQQQVQGLLSIGTIETDEQPPALNAVLRPYQLSGFAWLKFLWEHQLGGILADDMGLGKTLQSLALLGHARQADPDGPPFLIVAPTSVVPNWAAEAARFAPDLNVVAVTETQAKRKKLLGATVAGADVVVTSYTLLRIDFDAYAGLAWSGLILDEAQNAKNHQSKIYQCARRLPAQFKLAITGTPMENNLMELWSLLSITAPGLFPHPAQFREYYARPIENQGKDHAELLAQLRRRIKPLVRRRTKEQVAADLPAKQEQVLEVELHPRHRKLYQTHLQRERQKVLGLIDDLNANRFTILRSLTLLRQLSLHAGLIDSSATGPVDGLTYSEPDHEIPSAKIDALLDHLRPVIGTDHRALVFSQFTGFLREVRYRLDAEGIPYCYLDGSTRDRAGVLRRFKEGSDPVFLISLKAGGFGLNLTEADYCFLLDPWWNPATEAQAVDRTHRIGQTRNVMVYRLIAKDTIEEKVMALKARKAGLFSSVLDDGNAFGATLTAEDIRGLFT
jgi:superfamily II DNA or RNA helicase